MANLHQIAQQFVSNVGFGTPTLYDPAGGQPFNWYWYGEATRVGGDAYQLSQLPVPPPNPPSPFVAPGQAQIGWSDGGTAPAPFCGSVENGARFLAITDCSGFVAYMTDKAGSAAFLDYVRYAGELVNALPELRELDGRHTQRWPSAADWAFAGYTPAPVALPQSWQLIANAANLDANMNSIAPGDVLAWALTGTNSQDTGHVMIVDRVTANSDGTWTFSIFDASSLTHANDSRQGKTGIGSGEIGFRKSGTGWEFNFNPPDPGFHWNPVTVLAILRMAS